MWQRTQIIVNIYENKGGKFKAKRRLLKSFALHNQWWYWRPLVTWALSIVKYAKQYAKYAIDIDEKNLHRVACRPMWLDELFNRHEPYKCTNTYQAMEHDNDDWWAIVDLTIDRKDTWEFEVESDVHIYNEKWEEMWAMEYIYYKKCQLFCNDTRQRWFNMNGHLLD